MKHITNLLTFTAMLEFLAIIGICGSYERGRIEGAELLKWLIALGAAIYITTRLIKVSAAVTANNSRRKRTVKHNRVSTVLNIPHNGENVKPLRTNRNGIQGILYFYSKLPYEFVTVEIKGHFNAFKRVSH